MNIIKQNRDLLVSFSSDINWFYFYLNCCLLQSRSPTFLLHVSLLTLDVRSPIRYSNYSKGLVKLVLFKLKRDCIFVFVVYKVHNHIYKFCLIIDGQFMQLSMIQVSIKCLLKKFSIYLGKYQYQP